MFCSVRIAFMCSIVNVGWGGARARARVWRGCGAGAVVARVWRGQRRVEVHVAPHVAHCSVVRLCWCGCSWVARYTACSDQTDTPQRHRRRPQTRHKRHAPIGTYNYYIFYFIMCFILFLCSARCAAAVVRIEMPPCSKFE